MRTSIFKKGLIGLILLAGFTAEASHHKPHKTIVLVHGAWQGPWAWQTVKAELINKGQKVVIIELPGHGSDVTSPQQASINSYRDKVLAVMNQIPGKVILVGHSMGGMVITAVADKAPEKIEKLVYVGAFLPTNGQSLMDLTMTDKESLLGKAISPGDGGLTLELLQDNIVPVFCADCSPNVQQQLLTHYKKEPAIPFGDKATVNAEAFAKLDKYYIKTLEDRAVGPDLQSRMITAAGITKVYPLQSGHSPFLSMPDSITKVLLTIINYKD